MALFEQRISDEQVQAARRRIESGAVSLRAAAAEIGCAPSTLSVRIRKAETADADALLRAGIGGRGGRAQRRAGKQARPPGGSPATVALRPIEVLRGGRRPRRAGSPTGRPG